MWAMIASNGATFILICGAVLAQRRAVRMTAKVMDELADALLAAVTRIKITEHQIDRLADRVAQLESRYAAGAKTVTVFDGGKRPRL